MRRLGVITSARSDFGIYVPVLHEIRAHDGLDLEIVATGMHLSPEFGRTLDEIRQRGFEVRSAIEALIASDQPEAIGKSMGQGISGFAQLFSDWRPDLVLVLGDRFDMLPAALAALPHRIPLAHIHGGELTQGAIDDSLRHCITKLSHLHFATTRAYADRIIQLGEEPWRVTVSGAPALDAIRQTRVLDDGELRTRFGVDRADGFLLVTFHPETLAEVEPAEQVGALIGALSKHERPCVITYPNADTRAGRIIRALESYASSRENTQLIRNVGSEGYFSLMASAAAMVGNSSSGIIEAASYHLPVVNVGDRQRGRIRGPNVIDCPASADAIGVALDQALSEEFRNGLRDMKNPYGDGHAAERIVKVLAEVELGQRLIAKGFHDLPAPIPKGDPL
jgi:UDP-hydrolysing UDP-N-acetyl-D-glucosamine 2-epimerase